MRPQRRFIALLLASAGAALASAGHAQDVDAAALPEAGEPAAVSGQIYQADWFAQFGPRNANEMLGQIPGFSVRDDGAERGLGQASTNVLINGQRLTSKTEDIFAQLARIPASQVQRIEIVDAATLDVPGLTGQVANVIAAASGGIKGNFAYRLEARPHFANPMFTRFDSSLTGRVGPAEFTLGLQNLANRGGAGGPSVILNADGSLRETRDDVIKYNFDQPKLSAAFKIDAGRGTVINLNSSFRLIYVRASVDDRRDAVIGVDRKRAFRERQNGRDFELGGDIAFKVGPGQLKLIGLGQAKHEPVTYSTVFTYADGSPATGDRYAETLDLSERVARAEYGWKMGGADWQLSAEAAFNRLESDASLSTLAPDGSYTPVPFPGASSGVKEARYESILSYTRPLSPNLSLQLNGGAEFSRLTSLGTLSGAASPPREFWRPKGSVSFAWVPAKGIDLSFKARRKVGQLNFTDFLSRVFLDNENANAGNTELVPPQSWEFELEAKKQFGAWGNTTLRLYDYHIEDLVDIVPIGIDGESPGNLPSARRQGIEWKSTLQLAQVGIKGAKLDFGVTLEQSRVRDPLTGEERAISETEDRYFSASFRHDIPGSQIAYGFDFETYHIQNYYRLSEVGLGWEGPTWLDLFVEHKNVFGLTLRGGIANLLNGRNRFDRTVYEGYRDRAPVSFIERRNRLIGPIFSLRIAGSF